MLSHPLCSSDLVFLSFKVATSRMPNRDLECGHRSSGGSGGGSFSDADEGSCDSPFHSTADEGLESNRVSSASDPSDSSVAINICGVIDESKVCLDRIEKDCRICHLSLFSSSPGAGVPIELGCSCKDDLAAAHKHCAETWFKIKGNKTCEICNSVAVNIVEANDIEAAHQFSENDAIVITSSSATTIGNRTCLNGHRFLNFVLACMVFAFVISWLFHFNIPS